MKLIICEKPNAAEKVAQALGKPKIRRYGSVKYWEVESGGQHIVVVPAVGHLYGLKQKGTEWTYPVFDIEWAPNYMIEKEAAYQKPYLEAISKLSEGADECVCACDYDTEGSLIGYNILRFACKPSSTSRMKFSTLTQEELKQAWEERGRMDLENALAGEARHILDWYYGINLSRALMSSIRKAGARQIMSIGRVQGPALAILAKREKEIASFVPTPYWEVWCEAKGAKFQNLHGRYQTKEQAHAALVNSSENGVVKSVLRREHRLLAAPPFDLTDLQIEAHRIFGFDPKTTLDIAQNLYENALISYPRTSSQKLPLKLNLKGILRKLSSHPEYSIAGKLLEQGRTKPQEGKKIDPAHPAIHPTGELPGKLDERQAKIYDLVVRRFLASFCEPAIRETQKVVITAGKEEYGATGARTKKAGWLEIYKYAKFEEEELPEFEEGERVSLKFKIEEKTTQPPKRYTSASLISELEKRGLGTKATRATIIETLFKRGYIEGKSIRVTPFGMAVYDLLQKIAPQILDEQLTRQIEQEMERIKDGENEKKAIEKGKALLSEILARFEGQESKIGKELFLGLKTKNDQESLLGKCPSCKQGNLRIIRLKEGKQFVGCTAYPACTATYSLPNVKITPAGKNCPICGTPMIRGKGKKGSFEICLNPKCKGQ
ncbi:MAG: DNA topoisomerase I [Candidatus Anstonellaceae archaeon]